MIKTYQTLHNIIDGLIERDPLFKKARVLSVRNSWEAVVGKTIAKNASVENFDGSTLYISTKDGTWLYELRMKEKTIMKKINDSLGKELVKKLKFTAKRY